MSCVFYTVWRLILNHLWWFYYIFFSVQRIHEVGACVCGVTRAWYAPGAVRAPHDFNVWHYCSERERARGTRVLAVEESNEITITSRNGSSTRTPDCNWRSCDTRHRRRSPSALFVFARWHRVMPGCAQTVWTNVIGHRTDWSQDWLDTLRLDTGPIENVGIFQNCRSLKNRWPQGMTIFFFLASLWSL